MKQFLRFSIFLALILTSGQLFSQISSFPYTADFEDASVLQPANAACDATVTGPTFSDWTQDATDDGDWRADTAGTTSIGTGPGSGVNTNGVGIGTDVIPGTTGGIYLYTEATNATTCGAAVISLISDYFDFSDSGKFYRGQLYYHMFGPGMGTLHIDVEQGGTWTSNVWSASGGSDSTWQNSYINLANYTTDSIRIRIRAIMGSNYLSDCAIDAFKIEEYSPPAYDAIMISGSYDPNEYPLVPLSQFDSLSFQVVVRNEGTSEITGTQVDISEGTFNTTADLDTVAAFSNKTGISVGKYFPSSSGSKTFNFDVTINESDTITTNNSSTASIEISDSTMAREDGDITGGIGFNTGTGEIGQMFELINNDTITTVTFHISAPTIGDSVRINLRQFGTAPGSLITSSDPVIMVSNQNWYTVDLNCPAILDTGKYFVGVEQITANVNMSLSYTTKYHTTGTAYFGNGTTWNTVESANFFMSALVRINFGSVAPRFVSITSNKDTVCPNELAFLQATDGLTHTWTPASAVYSPNFKNTLVDIDTTTTLTVVADFGCGITASANYTVYVKPGPDGTISGDTTVCEGTSALLEVSTAGSNSYEWSNGPSNTNWSVTPNVDTVYNALITAPNGCTKPLTASVSISNPLVSASNDTAVCQGESVTMTASNASTYQWAGGPTAADYPVTVNNTATYYVIGYDSLGCSAVDSVTLTANNAPDLVPIADTGACFTNYITLNAGGTADNYSWSTGSDSSSTRLQILSAQTVTLYAYNGNGCEGYDTVFVDRWIPPSGGVTPDTTICEESSIDLIATGGATYEWSNGATTDTLTVSPTEETKYSVVIYSAEGCEDNEETTVSLSPLAKPRFSIATYKDSVVVTNQSVDATSYMWDFGDGNTSANEDDYNIYDTSGNYTITLTATNNCGSRDSSFTISVTVPTPGSIGEVDVWNSVKLYPNPTSNVVNFSVGHKESGTLELNLTDVTGKTIWLESFVKSGFEVEGQVDLTELPKGVYFATFKLGNSELTKRIIKN